MNRGNLLAILGSLVLAALVAWLGNTWIERQLSSAEKPPELVKVLVAAKDIPLDTKIDATHLKATEIPPGAVPEGAIKAPEEILGRRVKEGMYKGEILLSRRLLDDANASVLSVTLTPGKRAVAVRVDDIIGVSGFILPGSRVDVISSGRGSGARTVLQDIKVLTVGQALKAEGGNLRAGSVTLEVDPRQAEILMEATEGGSVRLALRHQMDRKFVEPEQPAVAPASEPAVAPPPPPPTEELLAAARPMRSITIIKGVKEQKTGAQWEIPAASEMPEEPKP